MIAEFTAFRSNQMMIEIFTSVSNREWASAIWLAFLIVGFVFNKSVRGAFGGVIRTFFQPLIILPLALAALYAVGEVMLLRHLGWWSLANLKTSVLWVVTFAFVGMFEVATIRQGNSSLRKIARDIFSITAIFTFITELQGFSLPVELLAVPTVTLVLLLAETAKLKPEHASVAKLLGCIASLIGLFYLGYSLWLTYIEWQKTATWATALEFLIPIILSIGFLPFLWSWQIYVAYSTMFATISIFGIEGRLAPYARWLAITRIGANLDLLERWRKEIQSSRPATKAELKHSLVALQALAKREASPPIVQPSDGWSPYLAMQFMADYDFKTGHYHHSFDDEWFASSPMREFGDNAIWKNNIAYYVEGGARSATMLKIKLNVNDPLAAHTVEDMFVVYCTHLLEQAVSIDAVERMKLDIAALTPFSADIAHGTVAMTRDDFVGGIKGGYSRKFEISRGQRG